MPEIVKHVMLNPPLRVASVLFSRGKGGEEQELSANQSFLEGGKKNSLQTHNGRVL